jgi:hypothetical protein
MDSPSPATRGWALRLLTAEAASKSASEADCASVLRLLEMLRVALTQFVGADGFTALLRRALALARSDFPSLQSAKVTPVGRLEGVEAIINANTDPEVAIAITAHLLGLLVTFIGEPLTLRLMQNVWPESESNNLESEDL